MRKLKLNKAKPDIEKVKAFLRDNPEPEDYEVHEWSKKHGYNKHSVEELISTLAAKQVKKSLDESQKKAMKHSSKLGAGAKKRKGLKGKKKFDVVMAEFARGALHDSSGKIVTDRKKALAIAYSESGMSKSIIFFEKAVGGERENHKYIRKEGDKYIYEEPKEGEGKGGSDVEGMEKKKDGFYYHKGVKITADKEKAKEYMEKNKEGKPAPTDKQKTPDLKVGAKVRIKANAKDKGKITEHKPRGMIATIKEIGKDFVRLIDEAGNIFKVNTAELEFAKGMFFVDASCCEFCSSRQLVVMTKRK